MTETRDVMPRLESLLVARGLRVSILRAKKVKTTSAKSGFQARPEVGCDLIACQGSRDWHGLLT